MQIPRINYVRVTADDELLVVAVKDAGARADVPYTVDEDEDAAVLGGHAIYREDFAPSPAGEYRHVTHGW